MPEIDRKPTPLDASKQIRALLLALYEKQIDAKVDVIVPELLADEVRLKLDPRDLAPALVAWGAILNFRQVARGICANQHREMERRAESGQGELFELQAFYPAKRVLEEGGPLVDAYVRRAKLDYWERKFNVRRLAREARAKAAHSDALDAETNQLVADGVLVVGSKPAWLDNDASEIDAGEEEL